MTSNVSQLKTSQVLLDAIGKAASKKITAAEIHKQRISFVYGSMDSESGITKDQISHVINVQEGIDEE